MLPLSPQLFSAKFRIQAHLVRLALQLCSPGRMFVRKMLVSDYLHLLETELIIFQRRPELLALPRALTGQPSRTPLSLSRAFNTTPPQPADVFPSQLHDPSATAVLSSLQKAHTPQTLTEKIVERFCLGLKKDQHIKAGDFVTISPAHCMTHDNSWPTALKFMSIGASKIHNPRQVVMTLDHDVQNKSEKNLKKYMQIEEFAKKQGVDFYPAGRGIGHQIMIEEGYAFPGTLAVASDSHRFCTTFG